MRWRMGVAIIVLLIAASARTAPGYAANPAETLQILPGRAIGHVALGMTPVQVVERVGMPTAARWVEGLLHWTYDFTRTRYGHLEVHFAEQAGRMIAVQVMTRTGGLYALWDGSQVGGPPGPFVDLMGEPDQIQRLGASGGTTFLSALYAQHGIAFVVAVSPQGATIIGIAVFVPARESARLW